MFCGLLFQRSPPFCCGLERPQRLQLRVKGAFQQTLETALILAFANLIFLVHRLTRSITQHASWRSSAPGEKAARSRWGWRKTEPCGHRTTHTRWRIGRVGNQGALLIKISVRLKMRRKVYSWGGARRCTICDNVTVRSACRRNKKNEWHIRRYRPSGAGAQGL
jgi:hypothetical protein